MRRPIAKVTERRGGGDTIELSHLRPSIGTGCDRQYDWWSRSTKPTGETYPACYCRRVTARQLADTAIAHNRSGPSSPSRSRQTPERSLQHPSISTVSSATARPAHGPPEQPFETHLPYPLQHLHPDPPPPPFSDAFKTGSRATEPNSSGVAALSASRTCRSNRRPIVAELPPAYWPQLMV
jgi:hypothetical protein